MYLIVSNIIYNYFPQFSGTIVTLKQSLSKHENNQLPSTFIRILLKELFIEEGSKIPFPSSISLFSEDSFE